MPTLHETQDALYRSLVEGDDSDAVELILGDELAPAARLAIYRNTFIGSLTTALRISFPAVYRLVGPEFFEAAAQVFVAAHPPRSAYLDEYGAEFPDFLAGFGPAAALAYLPGVARLEWAVNVALHARDAAGLSLARLAALAPKTQESIAFVPHPAIGLVFAEHPVDTIWRAVLAENDAAMAAVDLAAGPVWLLIERPELSVEVRRFDEPAWRFLGALCARRPLQAALCSVTGVDAATELATHLAAGRFVDFEIADMHPSLPEVHE
ncbi:MAG TPA: DNA-binding domain-containing protein [Alphaproteobacteria bacterium]|nr:DNA-binding domain-containing protein [Alphaproteobacteria bacterium]